MPNLFVVCFSDYIAIVSVRLFLSACFCASVSVIHCRFKSLFSLYRFSLSFLLGLTSLVSLSAKVWLQFKSDNPNETNWANLKHFSLFVCMLYDVLPRHILTGQRYYISLALAWVQRQCKK